MTRLFIGIGLPDAYQERIRILTRKLANDLAASVNWTRPGNWHLTLKFLGETAEDRIPGIGNALDTVRHSIFTMQAGGSGAFPHAGRPQVLWLGLQQGSAQCTALAEAVNTALYSEGVPKEKKRFRPHLTLGRIRRPGNEIWQAVLDRAAKEKWPAFTADHFTLWQSDLRPTGAVHTVVARFNLNG